MGDFIFPFMQLEFLKISLFICYFRPEFCSLSWKNYKQRTLHHNFSASKSRCPPSSSKISAEFWMEKADKLRILGRKAAEVALFQLPLKVCKSQKQIMASWILPKNERWGNFQYIKLPQRSFFGRIQDNIYFFFEIFSSKQYLI